MSTADKHGVDTKEDAKGKRKGGKKPKMQRQKKAVGMSSCFVSIFRNGQKDNFRQLPADCVRTLDYLGAILQETGTPNCIACMGKGKVWNPRKRDLVVCEDCEGSGTQSGYQFEDIYRIPLHGKTIGMVQSMLESRLRDCVGVGYLLPNVEKYQKKNYGVGNIAPIGVGAGEKPHGKSGSLLRARYNAMKKYFDGWNFLNAVYFGVSLTEAYEFTERHMRPFLATVQAICKEQGRTLSTEDILADLANWIELVHECKDTARYHTKIISENRARAIKVNEREVDAYGLDNVYSPNGLTYWDEIYQRLERYNFNSAKLKKLKEQENQSTSVRDSWIEFSEYLENLETNSKREVYRKMEMRANKASELAELLLAEIRHPDFNLLSGNERKDKEELFSILEQASKVTYGDILPVVEAMPNSQKTQRESAIASGEKPIAAASMTTIPASFASLGNAHTERKERDIPIHSIPFREPLPPKFVTALVGTKREIRDRHLELVALRSDYPMCDKGNGI